MAASANANTLLYDPLTTTNGATQFVSRGFNFLGTVQAYGGIKTVALAAPTNLTGTALGSGTASYTYYATSLNQVNRESLFSSSSVTVISAANSLTSTTGNKISWTPVPGATAYRLYRTDATGASGPSFSKGYLPDIIYDNTFTDFGQTATGPLPPLPPGAAYLNPLIVRRL